VINLNWKVRLKNKYFWLSAIPALALVVQAVASVFGFSYDFSDLTNKLIVVVNAVFALLVILGIVVDPTTNGVTDSKQALEYTAPKKDVK
jgi:phi LC3 family holin